MGRVAGYLRGVLDELAPSVVSSAISQAEHWTPDDADRYCWRCGASAGPGATTPSGCAFCRDQAIPWDRLTRLSAYREPIDGWLRGMKFGRQWSWGPWLGKRLAEVMPPDPSGDTTVVCPVPMPWRRRWSRGFNQSQLIAEAFADARALCFADLLTRTRYAVPQTAVAPSDRASNVRGSITLRPIQLEGCRVVLVDDIKTTGATLGTCARLLRKAGVQHIHVVVAAVADPKHQDFKTV